MHHVILVYQCILGLLPEVIFSYVKNCVTAGVNGFVPLENFNRSRHIAVLTQANGFYTIGPYRLISSAFI